MYDIKGNESINKKVSQSPHSPLLFEDTTVPTQNILHLVFFGRFNMASYITTSPLFTDQP
jgi:hypothetical protein